MGGITLQDLLPMFPWEGPPAPRFLGIYWPWYRDSKDSNSSLAPVIPSLSTLYQNTEEIEVVRDANGSIAKVIRHIKVTKNE